MEQRGGVLYRLEEGAGGLAFIPADVAVRLAPLSSVTPVVGVLPPAVGIAMADGRVVTVLEVGALGHRNRGARRGARGEAEVPGADRAVLCDLGGEAVAITGGLVVATGLFEAGDDGGVVWLGERVPALDVRGICAQAEAAIWAARSAGPAKNGSAS